LLSAGDILATISADKSIRALRACETVSTYRNVRFALVFVALVDAMVIGIAVVVLATIR